MTKKQEKKLKKKIKKAVLRFYEQLNGSSNPTPSLFRLMMFRISRNLIKVLDPKFRDYQYFKEKGWFKSSYYYDTKIGPIKKLAGSFADFIGKRMAKSQ
jgi:hypothetical protein